MTIDNAKEMPVAASDSRADRGSAARAVDDAITSRRAVRGFLSRPVSRSTIEEILEVAGRAPSGANMQPWRVYVLCGARRNGLVEAILHAHDHEEEQHRREYDYYPVEFFEPYAGRRRQLGVDLYSTVGIAKGDAAAMRAQRRRNFSFFGAPVGLIFTIDKRLSVGSWLDYGTFLQSIMVAARARGLDTCPQAAFIQFHAVIREQLSLGPDERVVCGMSLGYADPAAPENSLQTRRIPVAHFATFLDS